MGGCHYEQAVQQPLALPEQCMVRGQLGVILPFRSTMVAVG